MADFRLKTRKKSRKMAKKKDITHFFDREQKKLLRSLRAQIKDLTEVLKLVAASQDVDMVRKEHMDFLGTVGSRTLTAKEREMAKEGISLDELRKLCGRKMSASEKSTSVRDGLPHGHVLRVVFAEHALLLYYLSDLEAINGLIQQMHSWNGNKKQLGKLVQVVRHLCSMDAHPVREERVIFPQLVAHGLDDLPQSLCAEHTKMHKVRIELKLLADSIEKMDFGLWKQHLDEVVCSFVPAVREHVYKEETILYPKALKVIQEPQMWDNMKAACDDIGICCF
jgi:DUF438 domain-containing protein